MKKTTKKELLDSIKFFTDLPAPLLGPKRVELTIKEDFKKYDSECENSVPHNINTDPFEIINFDCVEYVNAKIDGVEPRQDQFLRKTEYIARDYFKKQEIRSKFLTECKAKKEMGNIDYFSYYDVSFKDIDGPIEHPRNAKIVAAFDLYLSKKKVDAFYYEDGEIREKPNKFIEVDQSPDELIAIEIGEKFAELVDVERYFKIKKS